MEKAYTPNTAAVRITASSLNCPVPMKNAMIYVRKKYMAMAAGVTMRSVKPIPFHNSFVYLLFDFALLLSASIGKSDVASAIPMRDTGKLWKLRAIEYMVTAPSPSVEAIAVNIHSWI